MCTEKTLDIKSGDVIVGVEQQAVSPCIPASVSKTVRVTYNLFSQYDLDCLSVNFVHYIEFIIEELTLVNQTVTNPFKGL